MSKKKNYNPIWDNDLIQFARLICEINATCELSADDWQQLCDGMDLDRSDVVELFDRAHAVWENSKREVLS